MYRLVQCTVRLDAQPPAVVNQPLWLSHLLARLLIFFCQKADILVVFDGRLVLVLPNKDSTFG